MGTRECFAKVIPMWVWFNFPDVGREATQTEGKYFLGLREDDKWDNMIVHEVVCCEGTSEH
jgi:hypothetical protein